METPPSMMKIQTFKYDSAPQQPIFFNNNNTNTTTSVMELHNFRSAPPAFTRNVGTTSTTDMNPTDVSFSTHLKPPPEHHHQLKSSAAPVIMGDSEISIFDAQKYFNESNPDPKTRSSSSFSPLQISIHNHTNLTNHANIPRLSSVDGYNRARSFHATPTASSEASWNSQTGLLSNPPGALAVSLKNLPSKPDTHQERKIGGISNRTNGGTKWFFLRKCPCSGKKSVQVEELVVISESKTQSPASYTESQIINYPHHQNQNLGQIQEIREIIPSHQQRLSSSSIQENHFPTKGFHHHRQQRLSASGRPLSDGPCGGFSFPILQNPSLPPQSALDDPPRDSLEVFQPVDEQPVPRKAGGRGFGFPGSPISGVTATDDDMASDASSDLFEIESFSTQTTSYPMFRRRDSPENFHATRRLSASNIYCTRRSMDEPMTASIAPTECYEPSEASIDWSVTTAEGFDRTSVTNFSFSASEIDDVAIARHAWVANNQGGEGGRKKGNGGGLLMSCRHEKAVTVGPQPVKCVAAAGDQGQHGGGGGPAAVAGGKLPFMHVSSRGGAVDASNSNVKPPPLARSRSARLSLAFAA